MHIKIFTNGFTEQDFNDFQAHNIVYKFQFADNGDMYVFYKEPSLVGNLPIEDLEQIDRLCKQAANEMLAAKLDVAHNQESQASKNTELADAKEEISQYKTNQAQWGQLDAKIKKLEGELLQLQREEKQSTSTIDERQAQVVAFKAKAEEIIKTL